MMTPHLGSGNTENPVRASRSTAAWRAAPRLGFCFQAVAPPRESLRLESVAQRKLDQPRRPHRAGDFAKWAVRRADRFHVGHRGISKVGVVPDVKEVGREAQALPRRQLESLEQREVAVLLR